MRRLPAAAAAATAKATRRTRITQYFSPSMGLIVYILYRPTLIYTVSGKKESGVFQA